jgi:Family of unknown function (DUF5946)
LGRKKVERTITPTSTLESFNGIVPFIRQSLCACPSRSVVELALVRALVLLFPLMSVVSCCGCGGMFSEIEGPVHRYMESCPGCWAVFGEVLAREYGDVAFAAAHPLTVDSYAVQHPGRPSPQSIQSVGLHLISLCLVLEYGVPMGEATAALPNVARQKKELVWLEPPLHRGEITIRDVHAAREARAHARRVWDWAGSVWSAWSEHRTTVRSWVKLLAPGQRGTN